MKKKEKAEVKKKDGESGDKLKRITDLAELLVATQTTVARLTEELEAAQKNQTRLEMEDLPELMREVELTSFRMKDGREIELVDDVSCGITKENSKAALKWLDENKFGGLIKTVVKVAFNREDREAAVKLATDVETMAKEKDMALAPEVAEGVHAATLKAFVKEELEKGHAIPFDLFSIHPYSKVKIKSDKSKKK
jgi:hypothetical protein